MSFGLNRGILHAVHCLSVLLFLIIHSLHSQDDSLSCVLVISESELIVLSVCVVSEANPEFVCPIKLDSILLDLESTSITLPDFNSCGSIDIFFTFAFNLGAVDEPLQMKFGTDVTAQSTVNSFPVNEREFESVELFAQSSALIGLLKVKLLTDCKLFPASVTLIGLANVKEFSLFAIVLPAECEAGGGKVKLKLGNVVIGRGMFGKFTGATVSSCSRFILDLPFNLPRYFSLSVSSVLKTKKNF